MSQWTTGEIVPTEDWARDPHSIRIADEIVNAVLEGRGRTDQQRSFRMCITLCRHRVLSADEIAALPAEWHAAPPVDIAGGPVEILWKTGAMPTRPSTQPCEGPHWRLMSEVTGRACSPRLKLPIDCGSCEPCKDRARI